MFPLIVISRKTQELCRIDIVTSIILFSASCGCFEAVSHPDQRQSACGIPNQVTGRANHSLCQPVTLCHLMQRKANCWLCRLRFLRQMQRMCVGPSQTLDRSTFSGMRTGPTPTPAATPSPMACPSNTAPVGGSCVLVPSASPQPGRQVDVQTTYSGCLDRLLQALISTRPLALMTALQAPWRGADSARAAPSN